jgi:hypothetical protein
MYSRCKEFGVQLPIACVAPQSPLHVRSVSKTGSSCAAAHKREITSRAAGILQWGRGTTACWQLLLQRWVHAPVFAAAWHVLCPAPAAQPSQAQPAACRTHISSMCNLSEYV